MGLCGPESDAGSTQPTLKTSDSAIDAPRSRDTASDTAPAEAPSRKCTYTEMRKLFENRDVVKPIAPQYRSMNAESRSHSSLRRRRTDGSSPRSVTSDSGPAWLTISQLCRRWQLGRKTVYKFIDAKVLPAWKVGTHLYRVSLADVLRFESQNRLRSE